MRKSYLKLLPLPLALLFVMVAGCGNNSQVSEPVDNGKGIALLKITAAASSPFRALAKKATLTISAADMLTMTKTLTITDSSVEGAITGIPAGKNRLFAVAVYDSLDTLEYRGSSTAAVIADSTVKISINVIRVSGNAIINGTIIDSNTVTDVDGNIYHTVTIGTQTWMVENLKTTKCNDGTAIPLVTDTTAWHILATPGYCWYNNDSAAYGNDYGALYNWFAVNTGKLAPKGWHVPTDAEWTTLTTYLGGESNAGLPLKDTTHWSSPNYATNTSGFSALPGGYRNFYGTFYSIGTNGYWWSSTAYGEGATYSWSRFMYYNFSDVNRYSSSVTLGFSVRCIKDNPASPPPSITTQPLSQTVTAGQSVTFSVTAAGTGSLAYQWYKNGAAISGATSWVYSLSNVQAADAGTYIVTVSNGTLPNATSSAAVLMVNPLTVTDIDGNAYQTVKIGNQIWTVENLRTTKYNDGSAIPLVTDSVAWVVLTTPGYCYYNNTTDADSIKKFGALYNWYAVNTTKLAPAGWHVPTTAEWDTLQNYLISNGYNWDGSTTGNKTAKSLAAKADWVTDTVSGSIGNDLTKNNKSGFSALPGGCRVSTFFHIGEYAGWWSSSENDTLNAGFRDLVYCYSTLGGAGDSKYIGFSVRLLKD